MIKRIYCSLSWPWYWFRVATNLEYSGISLGTSQRILCNLWEK